MPGGPRFRFGPFQLDAAEKVLFRDGCPLALAPKDFETLQVLVENSGHVVTKEKLLATVWPRSVVEEGNLARHIFNLRQLLGRATGDAEYIQTIPKRGYRLNVTVALSAEPHTASRSSRPATVGRAREMSMLRTAFDGSAAGQGRLICVVGEPGIGKTTLVEQFLGDLAQRDTCRIGRGRCSERLAGTEAYLPILEILESLSSRDAVDQPLKRFAPRWHAQLALLEVDQRDDPYASTQEHMKWEFLAFLKELARQRTLVLFLDDVHWADASTVDLLAYVCARMESSRLLLVVTYRASDLVRSGHPFRAVKLHLEARRVCTELSVDLLSPAQVEEYLSLQYPAHRFPPTLAAMIHAKTEGNPLFVAELVRHLRERGALAETNGAWTLTPAVTDLFGDLPASLRSLLEQMIGVLDDIDRGLLLAASVAGEEFQATVIASMSGLDLAEVEDRFRRLEQAHGIIRQLDERELPDGSATMRYRFAHVLYQGALYGSLTPSRRASLSAAAARSLETHYGEHSDEIAVPLALLYEVARDFEYAVIHFQRAVHHALRRFAHREAESLCRRALGLVKRSPVGASRARMELDLHITLARCITILEGFAAPEVAELYARARALSEQVGDTRSHFGTLVGLWEYHEVRGDLAKARELAHEALKLAEGSGDAGLKIKAYDVLADGSHYTGEFASGHTYAEQGIGLYRPTEHCSLAEEFGGYDPGVACRSEGALSLWFLGFSEQARRRSAEGVELAQSLRRPFSIALALTYATWLEAYRRDAERTAHRARELEAFCIENGFEFFLAHANVLGGWARAMTGDLPGGVAQLRQGISAYENTGATLDRPLWLGLLADGLRAQGQLEAALLATEEGLASTERTQARFWKAELLRLRGCLLLASGPSRRDAAERSMQEALVCARTQGALALELRISLELARLQAGAGNPAAATSIVADVTARFSEGRDDPDFVAARALVAR